MFVQKVVSTLILLNNLNQVQITAMNSIRKANRPLHPTNQNQLSPKLLPNYNFKSQPSDLSTDPHAIPHRQFPEGHNSHGRKFNSEELLGQLSIPELNVELRKNLNEIISLIGKRKSLITAKKNKILQGAEEKLNEARYHPERNWSEISKDEDFSKITSFCQNPHVAIKMLGRIIQTVHEIKGPRIDEEQRSQQLQARNRKLQNDFDSIVNKINNINKQLKEQNFEVVKICMDLEQIEDNLESFVGVEYQEHVSEVEPLFKQKNKKLKILNSKINDKQISKDKKIAFMKQFKHILEELKRTREERLEEIASFFGIDNTWEFDQMNIKDQGYFANAIKELLKVRDRDLQLENQVLAEMNLIEREQEKVSTQLLERLADEDKSFHNFNSVQTQRIRNTSILSLFQNGTQNFSFKQVDPKEYLKKFKQVKNFFKRFLDDYTVLKQDLVQTSQKTEQIVNLLITTENEKERRHELLDLLETCIGKRSEYEQKRDEMRNIQLEESRNQQQMTQQKQDLKAVLTDGDLDGYKKIGSSIVKCEEEKARLTHVREQLEKQMELMDRDVVSIANLIYQQYEDILIDILPSEYKYNLRSGEDVKKLYKRLELLSNENKKKKKLKKEIPSTGYSINQKKEFERIFKELMKKSISQLREELERNFQTKRENKEELAKKCADGRILGQIPLCQRCGRGRPKFDSNTGIYTCPGYLSIGCHSTFTMDEVKRDRWV